MVNQSTCFSIGYCGGLVIFFLCVLVGFETILVLSASWLIERKSHSAKKAVSAVIASLLVSFAVGLPIRILTDKWWPSPAVRAVDFPDLTTTESFLTWLLFIAIYHVVLCILIKKFWQLKWITVIKSALIVLAINSLPYISLLIVYLKYVIWLAFHSPR